MPDELPIEQRITNAALILFLSQGIKKTTMEEVALEAGVTRVTVYRHFKDKKHLIHAAFLSVVGLLEQTRNAVRHDPNPNIELVLDHLERKFEALPTGDLFTRTQELKHLHPDIFEEFHTRRLGMLNEIFHYLFEVAERQERLRPGLDRRVVQVLFWDVIVNLLENPRVASLGLSARELHRTVRDVFLHGILR